MFGTNLQAPRVPPMTRPVGMAAPNSVPAMPQRPMPMQPGMQPPMQRPMQPPMMQPGMQRPMMMANALRGQTQ